MSVSYIRLYSAFSKRFTATIGFVLCDCQVLWQLLAS